MESFEQWLLPKLRLKSGLETLDRFSVESSLWDNEDAALNAFLSTMRSGGLFTNKIKSKFSGVSDQCKLCGQQDGMKHRIYNCPHSVHARRQVDWDLLSELPNHSMLWGLFSPPTAQEAFWDALDQVCTPAAHVLPGLSERYHLFTDGSCSTPAKSCKSERRAAWAVNVAIPGTATSKCIASGILPGRKQTAYRAEIYAVINALTASTCSSIYTDCLNVFKGFRRLQQYGWIELQWRACPDLDMWRTLWRVLSEAGRDHTIFWVKAHRETYQATDSHDLWLLLQNRSVDKHASITMHPLQGQLLEIFTELQAQNAKTQRAKTHLTRYLRLIWDQHAAD